jgi:Flp pilus assembly protein TadD
MPIETSPDTARGSTHRQLLITVLVIVALVITAYSNSLDASWHFDDEQNIVKNRRLHLTELTPEAIGRTFFADPDESGSLYRPVACLSFAINYYFGKDRVFGYHLVNLAIHLTAAVFLLLFLCRTLELPLLREKTGPSAMLIAALATLLWALNPIQTQAVTYIVQRMASMAGMFTIMALYFYLRGRTAVVGRTGFYLLCAACGILAVGSKENAVMLPVSLLLFDLILIQGVSKKSLKKAGLILPLLILVLFGFALIIAGPTFFDSGRFLAGYQNRGFTLGERLLTEPRIVIFYLSQLLFPAPGRFSLVRPVTPSSGLFSPPATFLSILAILALIGAAAALVKKRPLLSFAVLFFFANHLVESTVLPLELVYEHRNYIPSMFLFAPPAAWIVSAADRAKRRWAAALLFAALALVVSGFGYGTYVRNFDWKTEETLWLDAVEKFPTSARAYHNLGRYYADRRQFPMALYAYQLALQQADPTYGQRRHVTLFNMALIYQALGDPDTAEARLRKAIELQPDYARAYTNLALIVAAGGKTPEAAALLHRAVELDPRLEEARTNLGYILILLGRTQEAIGVLKESLEMNPKDAKALYDLGIAYDKAGNGEKASECFEKVLFRAPEDVMPRLFLAETYMKMGKEEAARQTIELLADFLRPDQLPRVPALLDQNGAMETLPDRQLVLPLLQEIFPQLFGKIHRS